MAFLIYKRSTQNGKDILEATGKYFRLGGYNLVHEAWEKRGKPTNQGWHINANELIQLYSDGKDNYDSMRLIIDFDPNADWRVGLIELLDIYVYTYEGEAKDKAGWNPMMLKLRDIMYEEFDKPITKEEKNNLISKITMESYADGFVEFLYLKGDKYSWNWGRNGSTNAAFIQGEARKYFKTYF